MEQMFSVASNERILYKSVIIVSIVTDIQRKVVNQWVVLEFNQYYRVKLDLLVRIYLKMIDIVVHQRIDSSLFKFQGRKLWKTTDL